MSDVEQVFRALASPVRREILRHLRHGELAAGEISAQFDIAAPTISRHLGVLRTAQLVSERRDGNRILYLASQRRLVTTLREFIESVSTPKGRRRS